MTLFLGLFILLLAISAAISGGIGIYAFRRRDARGAKSVAVLMVAITWWSATYGAFAAAVGSFERLLLFKVMFLGVVLIPAAFLTFTLQFTGRERWIDGKLLSLLAIEPAIVTALIWTDSWHGLFLGDYRTGEQIVFGPGFWLHSLYSYLLSFACYAMLGWTAIKAPGFYRKQALLLLIGAAASLFANFISIIYLLPQHGIDMTPVGFMVMGLFLLYNLRGQGLLDLLPIARHVVVEAMQDGVLALDSRDRAVDINPAARRILQLGPDVEPGADALAVFPAWRTLSRQVRARVSFSHEIALDAGGAHYIDVQGTPLIDAGGAPGGWILVLRDISQIKAAESELRAQLAHNEALQRTLQEQANRDGLTGLHNRRFLNDTLGREIEQARREGAPLAVAIIDIDRFKTVNDTRGHSAGDSVIKALANLLQAHTRRGDVACRYGGEEFVLSMPGAALETGLQRLNALCAQFGATSIDVACGGAIQTSFSAGVACFPRHGDDAQTLLTAADRALYAAKEAGRNRVLAADDAPQPV